MSTEFYFKAYVQVKYVILSFKTSETVYACLTLLGLKRGEKHENGMSQLIVTIDQEEWFFWWLKEGAYFKTDTAF